MVDQNLLESSQLPAVRSITMEETFYSFAKPFIGSK